MNNYYDEMTEEIKEAVRDGRLDEAGFMIEKELGMPYIPPETEKELLQLQRELKWKLAEKREPREESLSSLLGRLKKSAPNQLMAASRLSSRNLRECIDEIREYLAGSPVPEAAALLIEALGEQQVGEEFVYVRDGVEYTFWGDSVTPVAESEGFVRADLFLRRWLSDNHPDYYEMCRTLLIHEAYVFLPLSYDREEAEDLAADVLRQVSEMMDDGEVYAEIMGKPAERPERGALN